MSDAPERIWATGNEDRGVWTKENTINALSKFGLQNESYTRTDLIQPMIDRAVAKVMAERDAAVAEMTIIRDVILNNTKDAPPPHTVTMPDGTVHTGPLVDLWHSINALLVKRIDATLSRIKEGKL